MRNLLLVGLLVVVGCGKVETPEPGTMSLPMYLAAKPDGSQWVTADCVLANHHLDEKDRQLHLCVEMSGPTHEKAWGFAVRRSPVGEAINVALKDGHARRLFVRVEPIETGQMDRLEILDLAESVEDFRNFRRAAPSRKDDIERALERLD